MDKSYKTMNKDSLVSIIITTCNRCDLLPRAIKSVINQTYCNLEIIVIDDASIDDTTRIVNTFKDADDRIIYIRNDIQSGANISRNKGIQLAKGKFIAGLDDDDEFMPNRIELLLKNYDQNYAFITSPNLIIKDGSLIKLPYKSIVNLEDMLYNNVIDNQALIERDRLIKIGLYDEGLIACQDYDMWMRLILKYGSVKVIEEATQIVYRNSGQYRISTKSRSKFYGYFNFYKKYKYLMNDYYRKVHLIRIYDIKSKNNITNELAIKLLVHKISNSPIKNFSIIGINTISIEIIKFMQSNNIQINHLLDANKKGQKLDKYIIRSIDDVMNDEYNFIICTISNSLEIKNLLYSKPEFDNLNIISI